MHQHVYYPYTHYPYTDYPYTDRRGAPVMYGRIGLADLAGLLREGGIDFHRQQESKE